MITRRKTMWKWIKIIATKRKAIEQAIKALKEVHDEYLMANTDEHISKAEMKAILDKTNIAVELIIDIL